MSMFKVCARLGFLVVRSSDMSFKFVSDSRLATSFATFQEADDAARLAVYQNAGPKYWDIVVSVSNLNVPFKSI